jgi:hypothetical protein
MLNGRCPPATPWPLLCDQVGLEPWRLWGQRLLPVRAVQRVYPQVLVQRPERRLTQRSLLSRAVRVGRTHRGQRRRSGKRRELPVRNLGGPYNRRRLRRRCGVLEKAGVPRDVPPRAVPMGRRGGGSSTATGRVLPRSAWVLPRRRLRQGAARPARACNRCSLWADEQGCPAAMASHWDPCYESAQACNQ